MLKKSTPPRTDLKNIFGRSLKRAREASGLSVGQVAEMIGVSQPTYYKYESLKEDVLPSFVTLVQLSEALGVSLGTLAGLESSTDRPPEEASDKSPPKWVADLLPDLTSLDKHGQDAVKALVRGLRSESPSFVPAKPLSDDKKAFVWAVADLKGRLAQMLEQLVLLRQALSAMEKEEPPETVSEDESPPRPSWNREQSEAVKALVKGLKKESSF